jgi:hypothetical protein
MKRSFIFSHAVDWINLIPYIQTFETGNYANLKTK